jgi:hypothetical protein
MQLKISHRFSEPTAKCQGIQLGHVAKAEAWPLISGWFDLAYFWMRFTYSFKEAVGPFFFPPKRSRGSFMALTNDPLRGLRCAKSEGRVVEVEP